MDTIYAGAQKQELMGTIDWGQVLCTGVGGGMWDWQDWACSEAVDVQGSLSQIVMFSASQHTSLAQLWCRHKPFSTCARVVTELHCPDWAPYKDLTFSLESIV